MTWNNALWEYANRDGRLWLTAEEFLTNVEANRMARLKEGQKPRKPLQRGPFGREYRLRGWYWEFKPKPKTSIAPNPEVTP